MSFYDWGACCASGERADGFVAFSMIGRNIRGKGVYRTRRMFLSRIRHQWVNDFACFCFSDGVLADWLTALPSRPGTRL